MNEFTRGRLSALRMMLADQQSRLRQGAAAEILKEVLMDEGENRQDPPSPEGLRRISRAGGLEEIREFGRKLFCDDISLSEAVKTIRERFGLRQGDLARMIGSSPAALSRAMNGNERSIRHVLAAMAEFFGIGGAE